MKKNINLIKKIFNITIHLLLMSFVAWLTDTFKEGSSLYNAFTVIDYLIIISGAIQLISIVQEPLQDMYYSHKERKLKHKLKKNIIVEENVVEEKVVKENVVEVKAEPVEVKNAEKKENRP